MVRLTLAQLAMAVGETLDVDMMFGCVAAGSGNDVTDSIALSTSTASTEISSSPSVVTEDRFVSAINHCTSALVPNPSPQDQAASAARLSKASSSMALAWDVVRSAVGSGSIQDTLRNNRTLSSCVVACVISNTGLYE